MTDLVAGRWLRGRRSAELWRYDLRAHDERLLWRSPPGTITTIDAIAWSPDGHEIAVSSPAETGRGNYVAVAVDVRSGRYRRLFDSGGLISTMAWAPDGQAIAITSLPSAGASSARVTVLRTSGSPVKEWPAELSPSPITPFLAWIGDRLYFDSSAMGPQRENAGLYERPVSGRSTLRITPLDKKVADCSAPVGTRTACVWQSPTDRPRVAILDLRTRAVHLLGDINPELDSVQLGPVEELHWTNKFGDPTNGYLVLPPRALGKREHLPLVVMGHGFDGSFVAAANWWLTSYPAQAFARDGVAVLLVNQPKWPEWRGSDFRQGARAFGYGPLASLEAIIDRLSRQGLIDASRVGFTGHSWSGFWVQFTASHSNLLRAAALLNGGTVTEPGSYWEMGDALILTQQDRFMGGGPYPPTLRNYIGYSASLTADRVQVPVLIQDDSDEAPNEMEYYVALRVHHVPVDFHIYPHDGHNFFVPSHRLISMQENLDWFEFWLLGKVRNDPTAAEQYAIWMQMQEALRHRDGEN